MTQNKAQSSIIETKDPAEVMRWAEQRGVTILVNLPGSHGDHYVRVDKKDFMLKMSLQASPLRTLPLSSTYYYEPVRKTIFTA